MRRRTEESTIPLLPAPGETGASLPEWTADTELLQGILAKATLNYIQQVNKSLAGEKIPLTPSGSKLAAGVIADAIELTLGGAPVETLQPQDLRAAIKTGLKKRSEEERRGISLLGQLDQPSGAGGRLKLGDDLAIPRDLIKAGEDEAYRYLKVPKPMALRQVIKLADKRIKVVPETAKESLTGQSGLPHRPGDPYDIKRYLNLPGMETSAVVNRGEVAARVIGGQSPDYDRRKPLGIDELKLLAKILSEPEASQEVLAVAAAAAAELMGHQPELVAPAESALTDFGNQMRKAARRWRSVAAEGTTESVQEAVTLAETLAGVPIVPLATQISWITKPEKITAGHAEILGKRHLWEKALTVKIEDKEVAVPDEVTLAEAFIQLRSVGGNPATLKRIEAARRGWRDFERITTINPEIIDKEKKRLAELFPQFVGLLDLRPDDYPITVREAAERVKETGGIISDRELKAILEAFDQLQGNRATSAAAGLVRRKIRTYQKILADYERWEGIYMNLNDATKAGDKRLIDQILTERARELEQELSRLGPRSRKLQALLERPNIAAALYWWQNEPEEHWPRQLVPETLVELDKQIDVLRQWTRAIYADDATPFSIGLPIDAPDDPKLIDYLKQRLGMLSASNVAGRMSQIGKLTRAARAIEAGVADRPFLNPLKNLILEEAEKRSRRLESYASVISGLQQKEAELKKIEEARASLELGADSDAAEKLAGIDSPAKRRGVGRMTQLKIIDRQVRVEPNKYQHQLDAAQKLIGLHRKTKTFTFDLPKDPARIPREIQNQRERNLATGRRAAEFSDRFGAVALPKKATAGDIQGMLDILQESFDKANIFIPLEQAAGLSLGDLMVAVRARIDVILAQQELPGLMVENDTLAAQLEVIHQERSQAAALAKAKFIAKRIRWLEEELDDAPERLIAEMRRQKLVLEL